jgi:poly(3-hydroxybutyrate) depolymerase
VIATLFTKGICPKIAILSARLTISLCSAIIRWVCTPETTSSRFRGSAPLKQVSAQQGAATPEPMINFLRLPISLPALCFLVQLARTGSAQAQQFLPNKYTDPQTQEVLEYNVVLPPGYDAAAETKYPLWVCLHAANDTNPPNRTLSADGKCYVGAFTDAQHPAFFMVPISQSNMSGWGDAGKNSPISQAEKFEGRLTVVVIKQLLTKYKIDEDRLYIAGPSMGARGTWDIIRRNPGMFAAAGPAAGPADPRDAALYASQNIWAINGSNDSTAAENTAAIDAIRAMGGNPIYTLLQNRGHDTWRSVFNDAQFVAWMYAQRRGVPWWSHDPSAPTMLEPDPQNGSTTLVGGVSTVPPPGLDPSTPFPGVGAGTGTGGGSASGGGGTASMGLAGSASSAGAGQANSGGSEVGGTPSPTNNGGASTTGVSGVAAASGANDLASAGSSATTARPPADGGGCNYGRRSADDASALLSFLLLALTACKRTRRP